MELSSKNLMRYFWIGLGCISFILGSIGIILPLLPTIPFYLLTVYCFSKGSKKLHQWFLQTTLYKKHLADFVQNRTMSRKNKFRIIVIVTMIMGIVYYNIPINFSWVGYILLIVWLVHIVYVFFYINTDEDKKRILK